MKKPKHGQQSSNDNAKDQLGDDEIVVSGNQEDSTIKSVSYTHLTLPTICSV